VSYLKQHERSRHVNYSAISVVCKQRHGRSSYCNYLTLVFSCPVVFSFPSALCALSGYTGRFLFVKNYKVPKHSIHPFRVCGVLFICRKLTLAKGPFRSKKKFLFMCRKFPTPPYLCSSQNNTIRVLTDNNTDRVVDRQQHCAFYFSKFNFSALFF